MLTKKMSNITAAAMKEESDISKKSQRIVLRYLSYFFGTRLVLYRLSWTNSRYSTMQVFIYYRKKKHF